MDEGGDDEARADAQRGENLGEECPTGTLRLPRLLVRTRICYKANGNWYLGASPSKKSVQRLKTKVGDLLVPGNNDPWPEVRDTLNRSLRGWSAYFCYGDASHRHTVASTNTSMSACATSSRDGTKCKGAALDRFSCDVMSIGELGVLRLERLPRVAAVVCLAVKPVGKPDAGNRHVRFDERGWETERWPMAPSHRAHPRLYLPTMAGSFARDGLDVGVGH